MKLQALVVAKGRSFPYGGKLRTEGEAFLAAPGDARRLIALHRAQADPAGVPVESPGVEDMPVRELVEQVMHTEPRRRGRPRKVVAE